jgi:hypothetical protein
MSRLLPASLHFPNQLFSFENITVTWGWGGSNKCFPKDPENRVSWIILAT